MLTRVLYFSCPPVFFLRHNLSLVQACPACGHLGVDMALGKVLLLAGGGGDDVELDGLLLSSHDGVMLCPKERVDPLFTSYRIRQVVG